MAAQAVERLVDARRLAREVRQRFDRVLHPVELGAHVGVGVVLEAGQLLDDRRGGGGQLAGAAGVDRLAQDVVTVHGGGIGERVLQGSGAAALEEGVHRGPVEPARRHRLTGALERPQGGTANRRLIGVDERARQDGHLGRRGGAREKIQGDLVELDRLVLAVHHRVEREADGVEVDRPTGGLGDRGVHQALVDEAHRVAGESGQAGVHRREGSRVAQAGEAIEGGSLERAAEQGLEVGACGRAELSEGDDRRGPRRLGAGRDDPVQRRNRGRVAESPERAHGGDERLLVLDRPDVSRLVDQVVVLLVAGVVRSLGLLVVVLVVLVALLFVVAVLVGGFHFSLVVVSVLVLVVLVLVVLVLVLVLVLRLVDGRHEAGVTRRDRTERARLSGQLRLVIIPLAALLFAPAPPVDQANELVDRQRADRTGRRHRRAPLPYVLAAEPFGDDRPHPLGRQPCRRLPHLPAAQRQHERHHRRAGLVERLEDVVALHLVHAVVAHVPVLGDERDAIEIGTQLRRQRAHPLVQPRHDLPVPHRLPPRRDQLLDRLGRAQLFGACAVGLFGGRLGRLARRRLRLARLLAGRIEIQREEAPPELAEVADGAELLAAARQLLDQQGGVARHRGRARLRPVDALGELALAVEEEQVEQPVDGARRQLQRRVVLHPVERVLRVVGDEVLEPARHRLELAYRVLPQEGVQPGGAVVEEAAARRALPRRLDLAVLDDVAVVPRGRHAVLELLHAALHRREDVASLGLATAAVEHVQAVELRQRRDAVGEAVQVALLVVPEEHLGVLRVREIEEGEVDIAVAGGADRDQSDQVLAQRGPQVILLVHQDQLLAQVAARRVRSPRVLVPHPPLAVVAVAEAPFLAHPVHEVEVGRQPVAVVLLDARAQPARPAGGDAVLALEHRKEVLAVEAGVLGVAAERLHRAALDQLGHHLVGVGARGLLARMGGGLRLAERLPAGTAANPDLEAVGHHLDDAETVAVVALEPDLHVVLPLWRVLVRSDLG